MSNRHGFTLLELILALAVVAIVATIAIPAWFERGEVTLNNAASLLSEDLELAQGLALGAAGPVDFYFEANGYRVVGPDGQPCIHPRTGREFVRDYDRDAVFQGVKLVETNVGGGMPLRFDERGFVSGGALIRVAFEGEMRTVRVEAPQGTIRLVGAGG
ncbi:prepilin-type N-terminal cleavage/methylation domain-containing protein [Engelhardtia mirabilis]|uniref:General secretion pathway GspH domain-containing protein n=1 Tax=Engelhardtia mirabilis TaxID=2528011 RepID=A0A518BDK8_9BACT|nr:hypothetical protein Pla133_01340 [Planctomycetes bacterium Pla133]QDU99397.1 hypothetical protein Pla86_01340 [Planctomycetes bacterium Pla86]